MDYNLKLQKECKYFHVHMVSNGTLRHLVDIPCRFIFYSKWASPKQRFMGRTNLHMTTLK